MSTQEIEDRDAAEKKVVSQLTDQNDVSQLAEQRTAELDAVIESIPHGVYVQTHPFKVRCNRQAQQMSGPDFPKDFQTMERARHGERSEETRECDGRWVHSVGAPIYLKEELLGGVVVNTDITERRLQEEALRRSEKLAAVGQLTSSIAHEINNPVEAVTNLLYLVRHATSLEEAHGYASTAEDELMRVAEITLQTLRFHRHQTRLGPVDLADLAHAVVRLYQSRLLLRSVDVRWRIRPTPAVSGLEGEIRQVLNNLVRNAMEATEVGGHIAVRVRSQVDRSTGRPGVRITVADTGEGIRPDIARHLFEPFQTSKEQTGTGLGLWVSKGIVEKHDGQIRVRSRRGERHGTVFAIWLPVEPEPHPEPNPEPRPLSPAKPDLD